jgi:hypothetical protein
MRLIGIAETNWDRLDGDMAAKGVDPMELPFDRFLNLIYAFAVSSFSDEKDLNRFEARLNLPIPGIRSKIAETASPWAPERETAALGGLAAALRGGA